MAVYNELQVGRYVRFLQKFLSIKGRQPAPLAFSGELGAVWSLFHGAENRYLEGWQRYAGQFSQIGGAGVNSGIRIRNPSANVVAVLEKFTFHNQLADTLAWTIGAATADLSTVAPAAQNNRLDARGTQNSTLLLSAQQTPPALGSGGARYGVNANISYDVILDENQEIPLLPGDALQIANVTVNASLFASWIWRERVMEEGELK